MTKISLHYRGPLKSGKKSNPKHKHQIRLDLHSQLAAAANGSPFGIRLFQAADKGGFNDAARQQLLVERPSHLYLPLCQPISDRHLAGITKTREISNWLERHRNEPPTVELSLMIYRSGSPGSVFNDKFDIDNRLKTLFDALHPPQADVALPVIPSDPDPVVCLLTDDSQITALDISTHQLLAPANDDEVVLVLEVRTFGCGLIDRHYGA